MKSNFLVIIPVIFCLAHTASANDATKPFSLRLELPADSVSCGDRTSSLAERFSAQTGLTVTSASCEGSHTISENGKSYVTVTFVLNYLANAEVFPVQAIYGGEVSVFVASNDSALFTTYSDCLAARGGQEASFAANTGLQVFAAYCEASDNVVNPGYSLVVEGFGTPKERLYAFAQDPAITGFVPVQLIDAAITAVSQAGGTVSYTDATHVFYYAPYAINVGVWDLGFFEDASECAMQTPMASSIFTQAQAAGITAMCLPVSASSSQVSLDVVSTNYERLTEDYGYGSVKYASFQECTSDLDRVYQNEHSNGRNVLGGICKPDENIAGVYVADLFYGNE